MAGWVSAVGRANRCSVSLLGRPDWATAALTITLHIYVLALGGPGAGHEEAPGGAHREDPGPALMQCVPNFTKLPSTSNVKRLTRI